MKSEDETHKKSVEQKIADSQNKYVKTDEEWKKLLTDIQFKVARKSGTERAYTGRYWDHKETGVYHCVCCGQTLFGSTSKFKSGTGWPSFWKPTDKKNIGTNTDHELGYARTEIVCNRCDAHLGHVFHDGPEPTGLRYCINSVSLQFKKSP